MKIQQVQNTNFKANKVSTTMRFLSKGASEKIEVFKLNPIEDRAFAQKGLLALSQKFTRDLAAPQKRMKEFFKDFLNNKSGIDKDYFLAVKDEEVISGGMVTAPYRNSIILLNTFAIYPKEFNLNALLYGIINDTKVSYPQYKLDISAHQNEFNHIFLYNSIPPYKMKSMEHGIKKNQPLTVFMNDDNEHTTLDNIFGTNDFESRVIL